jgi:hypothetical protein
MKFDIRIFFENLSTKNRVSLNSDKNSGQFKWKRLYVHLWYDSASLAYFFSEWEIFRTEVVQKIKTHFIFSKIFPPPKSCRLRDNVGKYGTAWQATVDNIVRRMRVACGMIKAGIHTCKICYSCCFSTARWLPKPAWMVRYTECALSDAVLLKAISHSSLWALVPPLTCAVSTLCHIIACPKRDSNWSTRMYLIMQRTFDQCSLTIAAVRQLYSIYRAVSRYDNKTVFALSLYFAMTLLTSCCGV